MDGRGTMISIIIPIYRRAVYLDNCLESVTKQTFQDLEIICVMDGYSEEIAEKLIPWQAADSRIKVIEIAHQGTAAARNEGIRNSQGACLAFIDSDDTFPEAALEKLYDEMIKGESDIVTGNYMEMLDSGLMIPFHTPTIEQGVFNSFLESVTIWNRFYRTEFIRSNNVWFDTRFRGDDRIFCADLFLATPRLSVVEDMVYCWLRHENDSEVSITHGTKAEYFMNDMVMWNIFMDKMEPLWASQMNDHMRYSCQYILGRFQAVESCPDKELVFLQLKKLILRIE